ncbi:MAG: acyl carrier protein [Peptococcaceae bacterium]|nr:acyl carrier protein [Peptococcaceae bacterium]
MVFEAVQELLADRLECDAADITMESTFHDLGIDSLDTVDLLMELEDKLDLSIELDEKVETVGDLVNFVEKLQK